MLYSEGNLFKDSVTFQVIPNNAQADIVCSPARQASSPSARKGLHSCLIFISLFPS